MPSTATISAKSGPGNTVTSLALTGVSAINFSPAPKSFLQVVCDQGIKEFDINASTTITMTISAGNVVLILS